MSSEYCSIEEAWSEKKKKTKKETKENKYTVPTVGIPDPFVAPSDTSSRPDANEGPGNFFPLPGETAGDDDWTRAFTLGPSAGIPGTVNVAGGPTLWRQQQVLPSLPSIPSIPSISSSLSAIPHDIQQRFDELARQLESLSLSHSSSYSQSPMQNTAELFLFVAIGLLLLLAIDTLLRFATMVAIGSMSTMKKQKGGFGFKMPRSGIGRRW